MRALIDGRPSAQLPADDRGLLFGESVFETIAFCAGRAPLWQRHMTRLAAGAEALGLTRPDAGLLERECRRLLQPDGDERSVVRIALTGGSGGHGYWPPPDQQPRRILLRRDWPATIERQRRDGLAAVVSRYRLAPPGPLAGLKHGNRLLQTLAARECAHRGGEEAVLLDEQGLLGEAISNNLVLVAGSRLMTPTRADVAGVGLGWLRETLGNELENGSVALDQLQTLSEVLVINSVAGIRPLVAVADHAFEIGPTCRRLQSLWQKELFPCA